jgi:hypothetical protein
MQDSALKRRLTPFVPLTLIVENGDNTSFSVELKLAFNMNVLASVREKCGQNLLSDVFSWIDDPKAVFTVLWGATLPYQPEYNSADGLEAIGEYMTLENRVDTIEALLQAYAYFVRKDKREGFVESAKQIVEILRTGKLPEARPQTESETTTNAANPSTSMTSQTSPESPSDSASMSSENSQPIASIAS